MKHRNVGSVCFPSRQRSVLDVSFSGGQIHIKTEHFGVNRFNNIGVRHWSTTAASVVNPIPSPNTTSPPSSSTTVGGDSTNDKKIEETKPPPPKLSLKERTRIFIRNLCNDYKEAYFDMLNDAKAKPTKAAIYIFLLGGSLYCIWTNPNERSFFADFIVNKEELDLVAKPIRNPDCVKYVEEINKLWMKGALRHQSFGLFSIVWRHDEDECVATYDAQCPYTQPLYSQIITDRLIDVGFLNKWWLMEKKMVDFDVNYKEWESNSDRAKETVSLSSMLNKF